MLVHCALECYLYSFGMTKLGGRKSKCFDPWQCWSLATFLYNLSFLVNSYERGKWLTLWYERSEENVCGLGWDPVQRRLKSLHVCDTSPRPCEANSALTNHVSLWAVRKVKFKAFPACLEKTQTSQLKGTMGIYSCMTQNHTWKAGVPERTLALNLTTGGFLPFSIWINQLSSFRKSSLINQH